MCDLLLSVGAADIDARQGKQQLMLDASSVCGAIVLRDVRESIESNRCNRCDAAVSAKCDSRAVHAGHIEAIVPNARCTRK